MKQCLRVGVTIVAIWFVSVAFQGQARSQELMRLAANFNAFGFEIATSAPIPGVAIYSQTVVVPPGVNVLYVTMSTTGDGHGGARHTFTCRTGTPTPSTFCQPGPGDPSGGSPAGWLTLQRHRDYNTDYVHIPNVPVFFGDGGGGAGDLHDNSIHYTWCTPVPFSPTPAPLAVELRLASIPEMSPPFDGIEPIVFIEGLHVFVDASFVANPAQSCVQDTSVPTLRPIPQNGAH
jgi:hypothetical protein